MHTKPHTRKVIQREDGSYEVLKPVHSDRESAWHTYGVVYESKRQIRGFLTTAEKNGLKIVIEQGLREEIYREG